MPSYDACQGDSVIDQCQAGTKGALSRFHPVFLAQQMQRKIQEGWGMGIDGKKKSI